MRKVALCSLDWTRPKDPPLSLGHASILATLKKANIHAISVSHSVNASNYQVQNVLNEILKHNDSRTDVGIGAFVWNEPDVQYLTRELKKNNWRGKIILGGPQVSYVRANDLERYYEHADYFVRGYAETAMLRYARGEPVETIKGFHIRGSPDKNLQADASLDSLPSPLLQGIIKPQYFIRWELQRGCPFQCSFCQHRESDLFLKRRELSFDRIEKEIDLICAGAISDIAVLDPIFNSGPNYLKALRLLSQNSYSGKISFQARFEMLKTEFLDLCCKLNENGAQVTLEFGLQTINPEEWKIINRGNNLKKVTEAIEQLRSRNLRYEVSLIYGLPNQTVESFQRSVDFCIQQKVPVIRCWPLMLLRGTDLYYRKDEFAFVESIDLPQNDERNRIRRGIPHVISSNSFTYEEYQRMEQIASQLNVD